MILVPPTDGADREEEDMAEGHVLEDQSPGKALEENRRTAADELILSFESDQEIILEEKVSWLDTQVDRVGRNPERRPGPGDGRPAAPGAATSQ